MDRQGEVATRASALPGDGDGVGGLAAQRHAVLASPVRRDALAILRAAPGPLTATALADRLDLHVTTVRFHLDQLERVGLVSRESDRSGRRGRPAATYRAVNADLTAARDQMIDALAVAAARGGPSLQNDAREAGRRWAADLPVPHGDARTLLTGVAGQLGFDPEPADGGIRLLACPFRSAARRNPQVVCQVHLGLLQGIAARAHDGDVVGVGLVPFAEPQACHLTLTAIPDAPMTRSLR